MDTGMSGLPDLGKCEMDTGSWAIDNTLDTGCCAVDGKASRAPFKKYFSKISCSGRRVHLFITKAGKYNYSNPEIFRQMS